MGNDSDGDGHDACDDDDEDIGNDGLCDKKWWHDSMADGSSYVDGPECMTPLLPPSIYYPLSVFLCIVQQASNQFPE